MRKLMLCAALLAASPALAVGLPLNPAVTQETIDRTICVVGWTKTQRPPMESTNRVKIELVRELGLPEEFMSHSKLDHLIPLELGGSPADPRNLELQPSEEAGEKDEVEHCLRRAVCAGIITLDEAQQRIWRDWRTAQKAC